MKNRGQFFTSIAVTFGLLGGVVAVGGQTMQRQRQISTQDGVVTTTQDPQGPPPPPPPQQVVVGGAGIGYRVLSSEISFDIKVVKGAPFSATAVSESVQTLADGNRIVHKSSTNVYRDSEGRTRRESLSGTGTGAESVEMIIINDPIAGFSYGLNPGLHTAQKHQTLKFSFMVPSMGDKVQVIPSQTTGGVAAAGPRKVSPPENTATITTDSPSVTMVLKDGVEQGVQDKVATTVGGQVFKTMINPPVKTSLGTQTIEGVQADG